MNISGITFNQLCDFYLYKYKNIVKTKKINFQLRFNAFVTEL